MFCKTSLFSEKSICDEVPLWKSCEPTCLQLHQKGSHHQRFLVNTFCEDNLFGSSHSSIRSGMFYKIYLLKNFGKVTGKTPVPETFFLKKLHSIKSATLLKRYFSTDFARLLKRYFSTDFARLLKALCKTPPVSGSNFNSTFLTLGPRKTYIYVFPVLLFLDIFKPLYVTYRS